MRRRRLTAQDFEALKQHMGSRWKPANVEAVRQVLVEGKRQADVAAELGVTEMAVSKVVKKAYLLHQEHGEAPDGWVSIQLTLPPELVDHVKLLEQTARANLNRGSK
ncbi:TrfB-related DNA-binding protein [Pseudomonas cedrina]|uniref:TrfB-related DNA-binding protein n=1 Tax=Pseudomonas cedrina TaxID=651740 RepID=UPI003ED8409F